MSLESTGWDNRKRLFDEEKMSAFLNAKFSGDEWPQSSAAISVAKKYHEGVFRDCDNSVPYINHPLTMACQAFALGVADDDLVAALLLHDVVEDNSDKISFSDLPVNDTTMEVIRLVTKEKGYDSEKYYEDISKNPAASLVKCIDRCNNLSTMAQGFTKERIIKYIKETEKHIVPLLKIVKDTPRYNNAAWILSYQIYSLLEAYKRIL